MIIRPASLGDAHGVARVHVVAWQAAYAGIVPDHVLSTLSVQERSTGWRQWITASLEGEPTDGKRGPSHRLLVVESGGEVVGWAAFGRGRDEDSDREGELAGLYVDPDVWARGVGTALMLRVTEDLVKDGHTSAYLWVLAENVPAKRFYAQRGWESDGGQKQLEIGGTTVLIEDRLRIRLR